MILNVAGFWICKNKYGSKYATVRLNMCEKYMNMPEYVWIYDNRHGSEYVSYNT